MSKMLKTACFLPERIDGVKDRRLLAGHDSEAVRRAVNPHRAIKGASLLPIKTTPTVSKL